MSRQSGGSTARLAVFLGVGIVALASMGVVVKSVIGSYEAQIASASAPDPSVTVIVAARDLFQGVPITEEDLFAVTVPVDMAHPDMYRTPELVIGRIPRERILANEFLRTERLADADHGYGLNAVIPRDMRAVSVNLTGGSAHEGLLDPGSYVDVLVTMRADRAERRATETLLQVVYVLAVNNRSGEVTREASEEALREDPQARRMRPSVTLAVTPEQAERVAHAARHGDITLALRNVGDAGAGDIGQVDVNDILGEVDPSPRPTSDWVPPPVETGNSFILIRGPEVTEIQVP